MEELLLFSNARLVMTVGVLSVAVIVFFVWRLRFRLFSSQDQDMKRPLLMDQKDGKREPDTEPGKLTLLTDPGVNDVHKEMMRKLYEASVPRMMAVLRFFLGREKACIFLEGLIRQHNKAASIGTLAEVKQRRINEEKMGSSTEPILAENFQSNEGIKVEEVKILGIEKNYITCDIYSPNDKKDPDDKKGLKKKLPTIVYLHGGGMTMYSPRTAWWTFLGKEVARRGVRCILPNFRNATEAPYPAGLRDCFSAAKWAAKRYGGPIVVAGDSGGANLAIATCMILAKGREIVSGCYIMAPMVHGKYPDPEVCPSHAAFDDYMLGTLMLRDCARLYTDDGKAMDTKIGVEDIESGGERYVWPSRASLDEFKGFPDTELCLYEKDPLRDEGKAFAEKLREGGVNVKVVNVEGGIHVGDIFGVSGKRFHTRVNSIASFASKQCSRSTMREVKPFEG
mmetsp:Transcript_2744/g.3969  ORF Transcript_2744/g.3969 Transcript_2744/m.3969 type:complete len:452 (-) Transcript_2744:371-1726(-)|eukprot:CAMPEP_0167760886 /NCGR_PEP_ID=MMETSP0110_2-20121227/11844_1 /TAXON_ID=629695 /ORGANISM="Gymnochlora sp., Strain CCMP2014" /LENGTH=451 /DNA_ID=CAMNT_0007647465 /DNA_START=63 /DNA_END=1418 /DNA_ORIENTATION=+